MEKHPKNLMEQVQDVIRFKHYSYNTEKTYIPKRGGQGVRNPLDS